MLLDIETRIGEIAEKEERSVPIRGKGHRDWKPSGKPPKYERLGIKESHMKQAQTIAKHPEVVEKVKAQARENHTGKYR